MKQTNSRLIEGKEYTVSYGNKCYLTIYEDFMKRESKK